MKKLLLSLFLLLSPLMADGMYKLTLNQKSSVVYPKLLDALDAHYLIVVSQIDILDKFKHAGLPKKFGKNFNTNNLTAIKAVIACNGGFGNAIANTDPYMMGLCPVRITLIEKEGKTTILFVKPSQVAAGSKALEVIKKLEAKVIASLETLK